MQNPRKCRLCDSKNQVRYSNIISDRSHYFDIEECTVCGFQGKNSKIAVSQLSQEVYGELDFIHRRDGKNNHKPERSYVGKHIDRLSRTTRILEVGPGAGGNLNHAKLKGHNCCSLDISEDNNAYYRREFEWDEVYSSWNKIGDGTFDLIILTHVIEHIEDPLPFLNEAFRVLAPCGEMVLSTPNLHSLWARILGGRWWVYAIDDHFSFFQPQHFKTIAGKLGMTDPKISTPNMHSFLTVYRAFQPVRILPGSQKIVPNLSVGKIWKRTLAKIIAKPIELLTLPFSWIGLGFEIVVIMARPDTENIND